MKTIFDEILTWVPADLRQSYEAAVEYARTGMVRVDHDPDMFLQRVIIPPKVSEARKACVEWLLAALKKGDLLATGFRRDGLEREKIPATAWGRLALDRGKPIARDLDTQEVIFTRLEFGHGGALGVARKLQERGERPNRDNFVAECRRHGIASTEAYEVYAEFFGALPPGRKRVRIDSREK